MLFCAVNWCVSVLCCAVYWCVCAVMCCVLACVCLFVCVYVRVMVSVLLNEQEMMVSSTIYYNNVIKYVSGFKYCTKVIIIQAYFVYISLICSSILRNVNFISNIV